MDFVRLKRDTEPETKKREIPDRKPPEQPPPPPQMNFSQNLNPDDGIGVIVPIVDAALELARLPTSVPGAPTATWCRWCASNRSTR